VLEGVSVGCIGVMRDVEQLLSLLLLECTHLILEHFALKKTLPLVLKSLELHAL
jgi:hypothetical protein